MNFNQLKIIEENKDYIIVFKPPRMHSVVNNKTVKKDDESVITLVEWFAKNCNADNTLPDNGLLHRLDYETNGLVLFAKNKNSYDFFKDLQDKGEFVKEYSAICSEKTDAPRIIMSYFRPYGPGRKMVKPETEAKKYHEIAKDKGGFYRTEILSVEPFEDRFVFTVRIKRGFRHQIRSHLCWIGCPILNDPIYKSGQDFGENDKKEENTGFGTPILALRAFGLFFKDPKSGEKRECKINSY